MWPFYTSLHTCSDKRLLDKHHNFLTFVRFRDRFFLISLFDIIWVWPIGWTNQTGLESYDFGPLGLVLSCSICKNVNSWHFDISSLLVIEKYDHTSLVVLCINVNFLRSISFHKSHMMTHSFPTYTLYVSVCVDEYNFSFLFFIW